MSTFTPNKAIQQPASGSFTNAWAAPVNANWEIIDEAFGGTTVIDVTGLSGNYVFTAAQYTTPNIIFSGTLSAGVNYYFPAGVGGLWSIFADIPASAYTITILNDTPGSSVALVTDTRSFVVSDGANVELASTNIPAVLESAVTQWQSSLAIAGSQITSAISVGNVPALPASQITSGTIATARLPLAGLLPGITIQADPGGTPTGVAGDIFYYY